jgi:DNA-binding transcriptional regulator YhcF (GntR family)
MSSSRNGPLSPAERPADRPADRTAVTGPGAAGGHELDIERDSDVPISTQIFWQLSYQIESARLQPGTRLPPVRELGAALRVNPNTVRAVYRRLADAGYVVGRHGAGTRVVDRPPVRRGGQALAGIVAETLRRAAQLGFTPDEVAQAMFTAATDRKRPGPHVRVLFAECTTADAKVDAERITEAFPDRIEVIPVLLDELPERLGRYHYDLVATTTFHADEAQAYVAGRVPVVAMLVGPGYMSLVHEIAGLPSGSRVGVVCGSQRGVENIAEVLALAGASGVEIISAVAHTEPELDQVDREATLILLSREAMALGLEARFERPERLREWTYEFDPAAFELLRRALERVDAGAAGTAADPSVDRDPSTPEASTPGTG